MPRERIDRSVPTSSAVSMAELTGPQRIEARMLDCLSCSLIELPQFQGTEGARRLSAFFGGVSTVSDLEDRFQQSFGASLLARFKEIVVEQWSTLNGLNPESSDVVVRVNLVSWAKSRPDLSNPVISVGVPNDIRKEGTHHGEVELINGVVLTSKGVVKEENDWKQKTKAGLQKGPGTYSGMSKAERLRKRHNGRGRAGNGHK